MKVSVNGSECLRCTRDKHIPKVYSIGNNMSGAISVAGKITNNYSAIKNTLFYDP